MKKSFSDELGPKVKDDYIPRPFFNLEEIASSLLENLNQQYLLVGPKGCGKSTSLRQLYNVLREKLKGSGSALCTVYVDIEGCIEEHLAGREREHMRCIVLVDNAQKLAVSGSFPIVKNLLNTCWSSALAFSPQVVDIHGYSFLKVAPVHERQKQVMFGPFSDEEVEQYLPSFDASIRRLLRNISNGIPGILSVCKAAGPEEIVDVVNNTASIFTDHAVMSLKYAFIKDNESTELIDLATHIVMDKEPTTRLIYSGFFYKKENKYLLVYPSKHMLSCLYSSLKSLTSLLAKFAKGADLEFSFFYEMQHKPITVGRANKYSGCIKILSATKFIQQTSEWECPVVEVGETALIKCCNNHKAIDFIVVDFSQSSNDSHRLFLVQVSHQFYQGRESHKRLSIMTSKPDALHGQTISAYFRANYNINREEKAYYLYVSTEEVIQRSNFGQDASEVYVYSLYNV